ncbi:MAG TPA: cysteine peptidase family C39 domain-containing protein, partial [Hyphomicrobiaceae bacterium]|nr:cysteine peptidase family C39 domain-containing protein [Hyphomicrobiaceae bacterium]
MNSSDQPGSHPADQARPEADYLLECLQDVASHYGRSVAATVLTAGLPLQNGLMTFQLVAKAAERVGLEAQLVRTRLADLIPLDLPAIVQMTGGYPAVLRGGNPQDGYIVYLPWQKAEYTVDAREFESQFSGVAVRIKPIYRTPEQEHTPPAPKPGWWFWDVVRQHRRNYGIVIVAAVVINLIALASPLFFMNIYDRVIPNKAMETLWVFVVGLTLAMIFDLLLKIARGQIIDRVGRKVDIQVACNLIEKILNTRLVDRPTSTG